MADDEQVADDDEQMTDEAPRGSIPSFDSSYDDARKAYGLASGLLLAWTLIGIDLDKNSWLSVNIGIGPKSPQAVPWVLVALIAYFAFRFTIEWRESDAKRRNLLPSRIDFGVAHVIGGGAVLLYTIQSLAGIRLADRVSGGLLGAFVLGTAWGFVFSVGVFREKGAIGIKTRRAALWLLILLVGTTSMTLFLSGVQSVLNMSLVVGLVVGAGFSLLFFAYFVRQQHKARASHGGRIR
jgi:lipid-A-disaccharide synthase-like uncharacterized protein